eukprot:SM000396S15202  [mRNA]  locus=s396:9417:15838:- [translate_table: standard]
MQPSFGTIAVTTLQDVMRRVRHGKDLGATMPLAPAAAPAVSSRPMPGILIAEAVWITAATGQFRRRLLGMHRSAPPARRDVKRGPCRRLGDGRARPPLPRRPLGAAGAHTHIPRPAAQEPGGGRTATIRAAARPAPAGAVDAGGQPLTWRTRERHVDTWRVAPSAAAAAAAGDGRPTMTRPTSAAGGGCSVASPVGLQAAGGCALPASVRRHVILPPDIARQLPKGKLLSEPKWRALGVQQSRGWEHYAIHRPEPHILLFRRPLDYQPGPQRKSARQQAAAAAAAEKQREQREQEATRAPDAAAPPHVPGGAGPLTAPGAAAAAAAAGLPSVSPLHCHWHAALGMGLPPNN